MENITLEIYKHIKEPLDLDIFEKIDTKPRNFTWGKIFGGISIKFNIFAYNIEHNMKKGVR